MVLLKGDVMHGEALSRLMKVHTSVYEDVVYFFQILVITARPKEQILTGVPRRVYGIRVQEAHECNISWRDNFSHISWMYSLTLPL